MTAKVFALDTQPGVQRDGTLFDKQFYNSGKWVRFQRGRPRKIGGYRVISGQLMGPSRGIYVDTKNGFSSVFSGYSDGLQKLIIDDNAVGAGVFNFTLSNFTASPKNLWQFDSFKDVSGSGNASLVGHPGQNLDSITSTVITPVLIGDIDGLSMSQIGVFTDSLTLNGTTTATLGATNLLVAAGQTVTGTNIPANTTVVSVSTTTVVLSNAATGSGTVTATFNNNVEVSGGVVILHPYIFVYGENGFIRNCSAGNAEDWVSADANTTNVASGKIVRGLPVRGGSNSPSGLFWATDSLIRVSYNPTSITSGATTITQYWRYDIVTSQSSILSSQCVIEYDGIYYWIGVDRFLLYNGVVKEIPNNMNQNFFFDNLNYNQRQKVWATKVPRFGEIWWFYPRGDATECNDAIIFNVRENCWYDAGSAEGARRSAGYFSQVLSFPIMADWVTTASEEITTASCVLTTGSVFACIDTLNSDIAIDQVISGTGITAGTTVLAITSSGLKTLGSLVGGSGYTDATYTDVPFTTGTGFNATADIVVSGGAVTSVTIVDPGAGYLVGDVLNVNNATLGGGTNFSITVSAIYPQVLTLSAAATSTSTQTLTFSTQDDLIKMLQHEHGTDYVNNQEVTAIESFFETNDLGWVSGGPSQPSPVGDNKWLRLERVEPDFLLDGEMSLIVTGRPYAQSDDYESSPYVFDSNTNKIDMKEQRRELRLRFVSNVVGGDYQTGKVIVSADVGDVRGY